jgi:hypothetical protein
MDTHILAKIGKTLQFQLFARKKVAIHRQVLRTAIMVSKFNNGLSR